MDCVWSDLSQAARKVLKPRAVSKIIEAGGVAAAVESVSGKIYVGVCVDTACTLAYVLKEMPFLIRLQMAKMRYVV